MNDTCSRQLKVFNSYYKCIEGEKLNKILLYNQTNNLVSMYWLDCIIFLNTWADPLILVQNRYTIPSSAWYSERSPLFREQPPLLPNLPLQSQPPLQSHKIEFDWKYDLKKQQPSLQMRCSLSFVMTWTQMGFFFRRVRRVANIMK